jgi:Zn-dependent protease with chaperone function
VKRPSPSVPAALRALVWLAAWACAGAALADDARLGATVVRFASVAEGRAVLGSNDAWIEATSDFQRAATLGVAPPVSAERMREFVAATVRPWSAEQEARWRRALAAVAPRLATLRVPLPAEILLVDSDGRDAAGAPYTRGRAIVLPSGSLPDAGAAADAMVLAHELFHVVSRHDPELATRLYRTIGFESVAPLQWPAAWLPQRIANPDAPFDRHAMRIAIDGTDAWVMPVLVARRTDLRPGETFFSVMDVRLLEVGVADGKTLPVVRNGAPVWHAPQQLPEYLARLGGNTGYIIHPEETMADNFALLVTGRPVANAALLERIEAVLTERR